MWTKEEFTVLSISLAIEIALALILFFIFRKRETKIKKIPLIIISITFIIMEIFKQVGALKGSNYSLWNLPLHFCSFFMFFPILALIAPKKIKKFFEFSAYAWSFIIFIAILIYPGAIYGGPISSVYYDFQFTHSFVFHELIRLYFLYSLLINVNDLQISKIYYMPLSIIFYAIIAIPCAFKFNTNFCNILQAKYVPFFEKLRLQTSQAVYIVALVCSGIIFALISYTLLWLAKKLTDKIKNKS